MATKIIHKKSSTAGSIPAANTLEPGEIAVNLTDKKIYSKQTDGTVIELSPSGNSALIDNVEFTATANQTTFTTAYDVGGIQVFLNGVRLQDSDFTATNGSTIVLASGAAANDVLSIQKFELGSIHVTAAVLTDAEFTATANQTTFTTNYTVGTIQVFLNGIKLQDADYTATNGTTVVLAVGADAGDFLEVQKFTHSGVYVVDIVEDATPQLGGDLASNGNDILFADNDKLKFGAGSDLQIYHNGSASYITDQGTGNLVLGAADSIIFQNAAHDENMLVASQNGAVSLYYDNAIKMETTSGGAHVTGYLSATNAMTVQNGNGTEGVRLDYNENGGEIVLMGTSGNNKLLIDYLDSDNDGNGLARYLNLGAGSTGLNIGIANASNTGGITFTTGNNVTRQVISNIGDITNYNTDGSTAKMTWDASENNLTFVDGAKATFGDGDDLQIYHDSGNSYVKDNGNGILFLQGSNAVKIIGNTASAAILDANEGGGVHLYYNGSEKLATTSTGVTVTGTVAATAFTGDGSGLTGLGGGVPAGSVIYHAANTAPTGFLKANGAAVSRSTYSDLFTAIGTTFGAGDGSSTFNVPDLRGEFMRGWDDSRGIDSSRSFGSAQTDEFEAHYHRMMSTGGNANAGATSYPFGVAYNSYHGTGAYNARNSETVGGAAETRPRNIALLACIKY